MKTQHHSLQSEPLVNPFSGWEWLRVPALILIVVGATGILRFYAGPVADFLSMLNFPPLWACLVLLVGGVILLLIAMRAGGVQRRWDSDDSPHDNWRSL